LTSRMLSTKSRAFVSRSDSVTSAAPPIPDPERSPRTSQTNTSE
jgi:hypothetical protein